MSRRSSHPWGAIVTAVVGVAVLAGGGLTVVLHHQEPSANSLTVATPTAGGTSATAGSTSTVARAAPDSPSSVASANGRAAAAAGAPAPTVAPARSPAATTPTTPPSGGSGPPPAASGPAPATPGTYRYRQAGSLPGTPGEGTLVVAGASASGTQVWTRVVGGTVAPSTSVMLFNAAGSYLVSPGGQAAGAKATCTFAVPFPWPPWPTTPGKSVSGQASCTGPVSSYQVTGHVQGTTPIALDGHTVDTAVVVNTFVLKGSFNGSPLNVTLTETDWYAPTLRVPVVTRTHVAGTAFGLPLTTDRTDTLESATPS